MRFKPFLNFDAASARASGTLLALDHADDRERVFVEEPVSLQLDVFAVAEAQRFRVPLLLCLGDPVVEVGGLAPPKVILRCLLQLLARVHLVRHDVHVRVVERVEVYLKISKSKRNIEGVVEFTHCDVQVEDLLVSGLIGMPRERRVTLLVHIYKNLDCLFDHEKRCNDREQAAKDSARLIAYLHLPLEIFRC